MSVILTVLGPPLSIRLASSTRLTGKMREVLRRFNVWRRGRVRCYRLIKLRIEMRGTIFIQQFCIANIVKLHTECQYWVANSDFWEASATMFVSFCSTIQGKSFTEKSSAPRMTCFRLCSFFRNGIRKYLHATSLYLRKYWFFLKVRYIGTLHLREYVVIESWVVIIGFCYLEVIFSIVLYL